MTLCDLKHEIDAHKVISFDIFDTILIRPCVYPTDILKLVGLRCGYRGEFKSLRCAAEKAARIYGGKEEITLDDIYNYMGDKFDFTSTEIDLLKISEIEVEKDCLYARKKMKEVYDYCIENGKAVIFTSDMYLSAEVINTILLKNGFDGYSKLYVSSEYGVMKSSGKLYDIVIDDMSNIGFSREDILHMGDNEKSDVIIPRMKGIDCVHIPRISWLAMKNTNIRKLVSNSEGRLDNTFLIGVSMNIIFDNPFIKYNEKSYFNGVDDNFIDLLMGPFILAFVKWMIDCAVREKVETLCFVYRDGFIPERIYDLLTPIYAEAPAKVRLYLTRAVINPFFASDRNGLCESITDMRFSNRMTIKEFIYKRLYCTDESEFEKLLYLFKKHGFANENSIIGRMEDLMPWIDELTPYFKKNTERLQQEVRKYCEGVLANAGKTAVYDVGYRGSVCRFLKTHLNMETIGFHLFAKDTVRLMDDIDIKMYYAIAYGLQTERETILVNKFTEDFLNENVPSAVGVRYEEGKAEFVEDDNYEINEHIIKMQERAVDFARTIIDIFGPDIRNMKFNYFNYFEAYVDFLKNASTVDACIFSGNKMIDSSFMTPSSSNSYKEWELMHRFNTAERRMKYTIDDSIDQIKGKTIFHKKRKIFCGNPRYFTDNLLEKIRDEKKDDTDIFLIVETSEHPASEYVKKVGAVTDIVIYNDLPRGQGTYNIRKVYKDVQLYISLHPYLRDRIEIASKDLKISNQKACFLLWYWDRYFRKYVEKMDNEGIDTTFIVWNEKSLMHSILKEICIEKGLSIVFKE